MKKFISLTVILALILCSFLSLGPTAYAASTTIDNTHLLYAEYSRIINEANEFYGINLSLLPYNELKDFCSAEEFALLVEQYCESRTTNFATDDNLTIVPTTARGVGVVTVPNVKTKTYVEDTILITFYGTFDVRRNLNGDYYINSQSFIIYTQSTNGIISFSVNGSPTYSVADRGRTTIVTQNFTVSIRGYFEDYVSVSASFYLSPASGNISAI